MSKYITEEMQGPNLLGNPVTPSPDTELPNTVLTDMGSPNMGSPNMGLPDTGSPNIGYALTILAKKVTDFIFPEEEGCVLCKKTVDTRHAEEIFFALICSDCISRIPFVREPICETCGRPLRGQAVNSAVHEDSESGAPVCIDCRRQGRFFHIARAVGTYDGVLKDLICEFKFYGRRDLAEGLGVLMAREVSRRKLMRTCDVIVPVPLHPIRLAERGYNQAKLLAREVASCLGIRIRDSMERVIRQGEQNKLGRELRRDHIRGAFNVPYPAEIAGRRVLLVDDVITTGNTASECTRALLRSGASEVCVIAAAISPFEQEWRVH